MAALIGANPIIAVDIRDDKLGLAQKFGATHTINSKKENVRERIMQILLKGRMWRLTAQGLRQFGNFAMNLPTIQGVPFLLESLW